MENLFFCAVFDVNFCRIRTNILLNSAESVEKTTLTRKELMADILLE